MQSHVLSLFMDVFVEKTPPLKVETEFISKVSLLRILLKVKVMHFSSQSHQFTVCFDLWFLCPYYL